MKTLQIFDNGGKTVDRYTVIIGKSLYTMSDDPGHPQGVNTYSHELEEPYEPTDAEKQINLSDLPNAVQKAIRARGEPEDMAAIVARNPNLDKLAEKAANIATFTIIELSKGLSISGMNGYEQLYLLEKTIEILQNKV